MKPLKDKGQMIWILGFGGISSLAPDPEGEYIRSSLAFRTLSLKKYKSLNEFGCTPLWGRAVKF